MSLECEGDGAACVECGDFDFLPHTCPSCHGVFCAAHSSCHHIPTAEPAVLCTPSLDHLHHTDRATSPLDKGSNIGNSGGNDGTTAFSTQVRCVVCQAFPCVLTPCTLCGEAFCAVHRFHGHEDAALQARLRKRAALVDASSSSSRVSARGEDEAVTAAGSPRVLCAPFTNLHPLTLSPVGYHSRHMDALALVVYLPPTRHSTASEASATPTHCDVGVCSLVVATEMSVGQLQERLVSALVHAQDEAASSPSPWQVSAPHTSLYTLAPVDASPSEEDRATAYLSSSARRRPTLSLLPLPSEEILREAPLLHATVVLAALPADSTTEASAAAVGHARLCSVLTDFLFAAGAGGSTSRQDSRVKALATRLYLQYQQQQLRRRATAAPVAALPLRDASSPDGAAASPTPPTFPTREAVGAAVNMPVDDTSSPTTTTTVAAAAVWPFRHPPPLNSFLFFNPKLRPCGADAIRPATAPRVVVALFTADATLPAAVLPMVVALGDGWPAARVVDRLREEVTERQGGAHRAACAQALKSFSLYRLPQKAGAGEVECLAGPAMAATPLPPPPQLKNADVLVLCPAEEPPGAVAGLQAEVHRLQGLTGKEMRALKADQMKLCSVM